MKAPAWAWIAGIAAFAVIFGVWAWQLPNILAYANGGRDEGLAGILSSVQQAKESLSPQFKSLQKRLDQNLSDFGHAAAASAAQAQAIDGVKKKIQAEAAAQKIKAVLDKDSSAGESGLKPSAGGQKLETSNP